MNRAHLWAVLSGVVALYSLSSCTTNQTAVIPPLPKVEAHVISGDMVPRRTIASTTDDSLLEAEFQQILASEDVEKETRAYVDRIVRVFYRTQGLLDDYDAKLDEISKQTNVSETALQTDDSYARLISAWTVREQTLEKIRYFYSRALEVEMQRGNDSKVARELQDRALLVNHAFRNALLSASNSTNRLAKQELLESIIEVNREFHDSQAAQDGKDIATSKRTEALSRILEKQVIRDPAEMQKFYERNAKQLKRETENARKDVEIAAEMEKLVPDMKRHLSEQFEQRSPQAVGTIKPGIGHLGMMNGFEFPAGVWALTYDDGPHPLYTTRDLANLQAAGIKATFFWLANNVSRMHSIVHAAQEAGMTLGNHSYSHPQLTKLGPAGLTHEIDDAMKVDIEAGYTPKFFRCPYGACGSQSSLVRQRIANLGMISVTWNVDSLDWQDKNPASVYARVKKQMAVQKRGIILFHDIHPQSVVASKMLMADFTAGQKTGRYRTVTIDQALKELNSAEGMKK